MELNILTTIVIKRKFIGWKLFVFDSIIDLGSFCMENLGGIRKHVCFFSLLTQVDPGFVTISNFITQWAHHGQTMSKQRCSNAINVDITLFRRHLAMMCLLVTFTSSLLVN